VTRYQINVIAYFQSQTYRFLQWTASHQTGSTIIVDNFVPLTLLFLDEILRAERKLYDNRCERYADLTDMLIEVHVSQEEEEFRARLNANAVQLFLTTPPN
jgi:hypothetical protein